MADEKLNTGPGEKKIPEAPESVTAGQPQAPAPEQAAAPTIQQEQAGPAKPDPGDVVVSFEQINELMGEKRKAARAEVSSDKQIFSALLRQKGALLNQIDKISAIIRQIDFDIQQMKAGKSIMSYLLDIDVKLIEYPPQNILYLRRKLTQEECLNGSAKRAGIQLRCFEYRESRSGKWAKAFLEGFKGVLITDGYGGYNKVEDAEHAGCWAHMRRKWLEAMPEGADEETCKGFEIDDLLPWSKEMKSWFSAV